MPKIDLHHDVTDFISVLLGSREQAHIFHWQTRSFAQHLALEGYYTGIVPLVDAYVEAFQGKYGMLTGFSPKQELVDVDMDTILTTFDDLEAFVASRSPFLPADADLVNIHADILNLIHATQYKLKFLS